VAIEAMMPTDFWDRCYAAGCVVVPAQVYSGYVGGDLHPSTRIGLRFCALPVENCAVGPDYWFMIDESSTGIENLFESPNAALEAFKRRASTASAEPK
jgi:hypothetical protein